MDVAVYKRSFDPEHDVVIIVTGKDVDWIEAVKNEMIQTLDFLIKFDEERAQSKSNNIPWVGARCGALRSCRSADLNGDPQQDAAMFWPWTPLCWF